MHTCYPAGGSGVKGSHDFLRDCVPARTSPSHRRGSNLDHDPRNLDARDEDPLLDGPIPAPKSAKVNGRHQLSPADPTTIV